jgi:hypothetical protein
MELRQLLMDMGDQTNSPDNLKGYGIPKYKLVTADGETLEEELFLEQHLGDEFQVIDLNGKLVEEGNFVSLVDLKGTLNAGLYILQIGGQSLRFSSIH